MLRTKQKKKNIQHRSLRTYVEYIILYTFFYKKSVIYTIGENSSQSLMVTKLIYSGEISWYSF
jgi:hypothetical protein